VTSSHNPYQLHLMRGNNKVIVLPVKPLALLLRVSEVRVSNFRQFAVEEGVLEQVWHHIYCVGGGCTS
jgi:hypothetical protein